MTNELQKVVLEMSISDLVKHIISGDLAKMLSNVAKVIVPIKRVEIRKTEVLEMGSVESQNTSIIEQPAAEEPKPVEAPAAPAEESEELEAEQEVLDETVEESEETEK
jgi:small subunit ribosomal protein S3Ae